LKNTPPTTDPVSTLSAEALLEWEANAESVLRGVAHALNNRAASMSALTSLCMEPDYTPQATSKLLATEVDRMRDLVAVVRAVGAPRGDVEAFEPADAAQSASGVIAMHAALRDREVKLNANAAPVRTYRWMFVRGLVVLAARAAPNRSPIVLNVTERDGFVIAAADSATGRSPYLAEIARAMGGEHLEEASGFKIPTLATLRQREGR